MFTIELSFLQEMRSSVATKSVNRTYCSVECDMVRSVLFLYVVIDIDINGVYIILQLGFSFLDNRTDIFSLSWLLCSDDFALTLCLSANIYFIMSIFV